MPTQQQRIGFRLFKGSWSSGKTYLFRGYNTGSIPVLPTSSEIPDGERS